MKWIALAILALGCGRNNDLIPDTQATAEWFGMAALVWPEPPRILPVDPDNATIRAVPQDELEARCGSVTRLGTVLGCTLWHHGDISVWMSLDTPDNLRLRLAAHELGHVIRGDGEHIPIGHGCPERGRGEHLMCMSPAIDQPDLLDLEFTGEDNE